MLGLSRYFKTQKPGLRPVKSRFEGGWRGASRLGEGPLGWANGGPARLPLPALRGALGAPDRARCADSGYIVFEWRLLDFFIITASASPLEAQRLHLSGKRASYHALEQDSCTSRIVSSSSVPDTPTDFNISGAS